MSRTNKNKMKQFRGRDKTPTRRDAVIAGASGLVGLTLSSLLAHEARATIKSSRKSIINIHLDGGPAHIDMIDMKPEAPSEIRGEFNPISTNVSGLQICELMPRLASIADRFAFVRSLVGSAGRHDAFQCQSGFSSRDLESIGGRPAMGSVLSRLRGSTSDTAPCFVDLMQGRPLVRNSARPGFLGPSHKPFRPDISQLFARPLEQGMKNELAALGTDHSTKLTLIDSLSENRLNERTDLLAQLDLTRRTLDASGEMEAMDRFTQQAVGILTSGDFANAIDIAKVPAECLDRYTAPSKEGSYRFTTADNAMATRKLLFARRLIEAGVRCVSVSFSDFDTHSKNFPRLRHMLPIVDFGIHALITDLEERGMLDDVTIVIWGEFGRSPRIDAKTGGRHHWPSAGMAMLAGGGMNLGQVIGATDRTASSVTTRPVSYQDIMATVYHNLGFDLSSTTIEDPTGRPQYLIEHGEPLKEVI